MKHMILILPLMALSVIGCSRNNEQARTDGSNVATAQQPAGNTAPNAGATSNGSDTSGTATGPATDTNPGATTAAPGPNGTTDPGTNNGATTR